MLHCEEYAADQFLVAIVLITFSAVREAAPAPRPLVKIAKLALQTKLHTTINMRNSGLKALLGLLKGAYTIPLGGMSHLDILVYLLYFVPGPVRSTSDTCIQNTTIMGSICAAPVLLLGLELQQGSSA